MSGMICHYYEWDDMPLDSFIMKNDNVKHIFKISLWLLCKNRHYGAKVKRTAKMLFQELR